MFSKRLAVLHKKVRFTCGALPKARLSVAGTKASIPLLQQVQQLQPSCCTLRYASTNSAIPTVITKAVEAASQADETTQSSSIESLVESIGPIPDIPTLPGPRILEILSNGEPSLESLGLAGYYPTGLLQQLLEFVHIYSDLPWSWTIILVAAGIRIACFKLVVRQRQESLKVATVMPQRQFIQDRLLEARHQNNLVQASRWAAELAQLDHKNTSLLGSLKYTVFQGAILLSFTQALRQMCTLPVEALQSGGFYTVKDLTMTDPTYILPSINAFLFYLHLATGREVQAMFPGKSIYMIHGGMAAVSAILFLVSMNFQGAIVLYWISSQCVTVIQHRILSHPKVKKYYKLEAAPNHALQAMMEKHKQSTTQTASPLGMWARFREAQTHNRMSEEVKQRAEMDSAAFERAGREPIRKTYKYDVKKFKKN